MFNFTHIYHFLFSFSFHFLFVTQTFMLDHFPLLEILPLEFFCSLYNLRLIIILFQHIKDIISLYLSYCCFWYFNCKSNYPSLKAIYVFCLVVLKFSLCFPLLLRCDWIKFLFIYPIWNSWPSWICIGNFQLFLKFLSLLLKLFLLCSLLSLLM